MRRIALLLTGSLTLLAQGPRMPMISREASAEFRPATPLLGFIPAGDGIRPVMGIRTYPGLGTPVALPEGTVRTMLSAAQQYALVQDTDRRWSAVSLEGAVPGSASLRSYGEQAKIAAISPSGSAAAFYREDTKQVEVVTGLPSNARLSFSASVASGFPLVSLAVSDSGTLVLAGVSNGNTGEVLALRQKGPATSLLRAGLPSAIAFAQNRTLAVIADRTLSQVIAMDVHSEGADVQILAGADGNVAAPDALAFEDNSSRVLVLNRGNRSVVVLSLDGKPSSVLECPFDAAGLVPMREKHLFALWSADGRAAGLIRTDVDGMRIASVPGVEEGQR